ncbi:DUF488 domain-containing protein [Hydrogenivirga sp. 128-5-R1-1]|uniref:DUF488 domain-containing protein n=1 Tax=Hydrogenivirga sp. 128-5-R1-1 TaxID=392423 RepID=UPI00015F0D45|nr:DUF488 domain-containing protein [Hydrogenivirga sp. 128-5-R1-1]EDP75931.1 hypothetical protein HG1285_06380 [Hydrogenivirga sp. 128-5-R1-1]
MRIYTVGHSSRELSEFIALPKSHGIELLVDVRSFPKSSRFPHFNRAQLESVLRKEGIDYLHIPELGGLRKEGYLNYIRTEEFKEALEELMSLSTNRKTAIMCAERNWRECHRRFIAEELVKREVEVVHILDGKRIEEHPKHIFL